MGRSAGRRPILSSLSWPTCRLPLRGAAGQQAADTLDLARVQGWGRGRPRRDRGRGGPRPAGRGARGAHPGSGASRTPADRGPWPCASGRVPRPRGRSRPAMKPRELWARATLGLSPRAASKASRAGSRSPAIRRTVPISTRTIALRGSRARARARVSSASLWRPSLARARPRAVSTSTSGSPCRAWGSSRATASPGRPAWVRYAPSSASVVASRGIEGERLPQRLHRGGEVSGFTLEVGEVEPRERHLRALPDELAAARYGTREIAREVEVRDSLQQGVERDQTLGVVGLGIALAPGDRPPRHVPQASQALLRLGCSRDAGRSRGPRTAAGRAARASPRAAPASGPPGSGTPGHRSGARRAPGSGGRCTSSGPGSRP